MPTLSKRRMALWVAVMLLGLTVAGLYLRANWPQRPAAYWLFPYPAVEAPAEMQRKAESSPAFRDAMSAYERQRHRVVFQALAVWLITVAPLLVVATTLGRGRHRTTETSR